MKLIAKIMYWDVTLIQLYKMMILSKEKEILGGKNNDLQTYRKRNWK